MSSFLNTREITKCRFIAIEHELRSVLTELEEYFCYIIKVLDKASNLTLCLSSLSQQASLSLEMINMICSDLDNFNEQLVKYKSQNNKAGLVAVKKICLFYQVGYIVNLLKVIGLYQECVKIITDEFNSTIGKQYSDITNKKLKLLNIQKLLFKQPAIIGPCRYFINYIKIDNWQELISNKLIDLDSPIYNEIIINLISERKNEYSELLFEMNKLAIMASLRAKKDQLGLVTSQLLFKYWQYGQLNVFENQNL